MLEIKKKDRILTFLEIEHLLSDQKYWDFLGELYIESENVANFRQLWIDMLSSKRPGSEFIMTDEEREVLRGLPKKFKVYRGYNYKNDRGFSYTLSKEKAEWFANRFKGMPLIRERVVRKDQVFAYLNGRNEQEIIILPQDKRN